MMPGPFSRRGGGNRRRRWASRAIALAALLAPLAAGAAGDRGADGHFEKRVSSHFVLYQDVDIDQSFGLRGSRRFEQQVLETLEAAYRLLDAHLALRPRRPITAVVYDPGIFEQRFAGLFRFAAAGFYQGTIHVRGSTQIDQQLVRVLHHELVHAAFDAEAPSLALPAWLNEGLAEWFEARAVGKRRLSSGELAFLAGASQRGQLFALSALAAPSFAGLGPEAAQLAYLQSYAFFEHLARRYQERSLRQLCAELLRTGNLERSFSRTFRSDLAKLEERFAAELAR
jgi:hypothetical protein